MSLIKNNKSKKICSMQGTLKKNKKQTLIKYFYLHQNSLWKPKIKMYRMLFQVDL